MPIVLPSDVVALIERSFPGIKSSPDLAIYTNDSRLSAIVRLTEAIPAELLTLLGDDYVDLISALESITHQVASFRLGGRPVGELARIDKKSPLAVIRDALKKCPDQGVAASTATLTFIEDDELRGSVRQDISAANQDFISREWKGTTVLAGSAAEALLLWAVQETERGNKQSIADAVSKAITAGALERRPDSNPERWGLLDLIEVSLQMALIRPETATQARLCKDFRNLIHPGRAKRTGTRCTHATALTALAAVEHIVEDLVRIYGKS